MDVQPGGSPGVHLGMLPARLWWITGQTGKVRTNILILAIDVSLKKDGGIGISACMSCLK